MQQTKNKLSFTSETAILIYFSVTYAIIHLIFINQYNYFRDELYYIACGNHLSFGYVDQPPFVALIAFIMTRLFGESLFAIRILSILAGALTVFMTGKITKQLGGLLFAQILSALMVMFTPVYLFLFHILSMNSFDILFWAVSLFILAKIVTTENSKYWLWFGLSVGIGFENKISILFLLFGLAFGLILTRNRKYLKDKYLWLGSFIALIISLPYLIWELTNGFPTIEFMQNASNLKNAPLSPLQFLGGQLLDMHPVSFLFSLFALYYLFFTKSGRQFRIFGWMYLAIFIFLVLTRAKVYYMSPAYPVVFVFGAIAIENFANRFNQRWIKPASAVLLVLLGAVTAPLALPCLPVEEYINYSRTLGITPDAGERNTIGILPQHFADMFGWKNMAEQVAKVYNSLTPEERQECGIYGRNYGEAGAVDFFGKKLGLPKAISGHNSYWHWGYDSTRTELMIVIGGRKEDHEQTYSSVQQMGIITNQYAMPYENNLPIYLCKGLIVNFNDVMQKVRFYI
jgi:hypothetical protein